MESPFVSKSNYIYRKGNNNASAIKYDYSSHLIPNGPY